MTPSCCGDSGAASPPPEPMEPEASDSLSLKPRGLLLPPLLATDPMPAKKLCLPSSFLKRYKDLRKKYSAKVKIVLDM